MKITEQIKKWLTPHQPLPPGIFTYHTPPDAPIPYRLHLRLEKDGSGVLIVNAATVLYLNQTAAEYAFHYINQTTDQEVAKLVSQRYHISSQQALQDYQQFRDRIQELILTPDLDPTTFLEFERSTPYSHAISAPYRLDCALTYRYLENDESAASSHQNVKRELTCEEWKKIIDKAWQAGIPHLIFTGGEPTLRPDLADLLAHAEQYGQVTGIITNGLRLTDRDFFEHLARQGLDHLMLVLDPDNNQCWEALKIILPDDMFTAVHLTITPNNQTQVLQILQRLAEMGANAISLSVSDPSLQPLLEQARQQAAHLHLSLVWDLPVPYSNLNPLVLELPTEESIQGAGKAWLYVEPDGDVLPAQGMQPCLGNMLNDEWQTIWSNTQTKLNKS